jgi:hypothetical protein
MKRTFNNTNGGLQFSYLAFNSLVRQPNLISLVGRIMNMTLRSFVTNNYVNYVVMKWSSVSYSGLLHNPKLLKLLEFSSGAMSNTPTPPHPYLYPPRQNIPGT